MKRWPRGRDCACRGHRGARGYVLLGVVLTLMMAAAIAYQIGRESALGVDAADGEAQTLRARYVAESGLAWAAAQLNAGGACSTIAAGAPITGAVGADQFSVSGTTVSTNPLTLRLTSTPTLATPAGNVAFAPLSKQIVLYTQAETQTTVARAYSGTVADTFIGWQIAGVAGANAANVGADPTLVLDNKDKMANVLLRFDLQPALLRGGKLKKAALVLTPLTPWPKSAEVSDITVHEVTSAWSEGSGTTDAPATVASGATWDQRQPGVAWGFVPYKAPAAVNGGKGNAVAAGGGDYDPAHVDKVYVAVNAIPATLSWDVTPLAAQWIANPASNFGLLLKAEENLTQAVFASSETPTRSQRPQLVLTTLMPCGGPLVTVSTVDIATAQPVAVATVDTPVLLRIAIANGAAAAAVQTAPLTVALPAGVTVAGPTLAATSGCGAMAFAPAVGASTLTVSGGSIAAASGTTPGVCTISVAVTGSIPSGTATVGSGPVGTASTIAVAAGALVTDRGANAAAASTKLYVVPLPAVADTTIDSDNEKSVYGSLTWLGLVNNKQVRVMLRFAEVPPPGVQAQTATLTMYLRAIANPGIVTTMTIQPYLIKKTWAEATATWEKPGANSGGAGDYLTTPALDAQTLGYLSSSWVTFDMAPAVNAWSGGVANNGLLLVSRTPASKDVDTMYFDSRERSGGNPPQLRVTY